MAQNLKSEHSAGGLVFQKQGSDVLWLIGQHSGYHKWVLPKGLIEPGETAAMAALREVQEEMGVTAKIIGSNPLHIVKYSYTANFISEPGNSQRRVSQYQESAPGSTLVHKTVEFFLMEWVSGSPTDHNWEMADAGWFSYEEAIKKLAFPGERLALQKAHDTISK